jgi:arylsulfatase
VVQAKRGIKRVARDPVDPLYARQWDFKLPPNLRRSLTPGRPPAHRDFLRAHDALVGNIPSEEARWRRRTTTMNCLRDVDRNIAGVLAN